MLSTRYQRVNTRHYHHIWTVGDIYGEYQLLQSRLHQLPFFPKIGLPISAGDNINHGPENLNVLRLLNQPWSTPVKSSYRAIALETLETGDGNMWLTSGGDRFFDSNGLEQQEAIDLLLKFYHLSHIIKITNDNIKYAIVRTDYPGDGYPPDEEIAESESLRPVDRVQKSPSDELQQINGADYFIFGYMMSDSIQTFASQIYIDTGSSSGGRLSFYRIRQSHTSSAKHE